MKYKKWLVRCTERFSFFKDVVTTGSSVLETAKILRAQGLTVDQAVVLLNREQGGQENLLAHGIKLHSLAPITQLMEVLRKKGKVDLETKEKVLEFVRNNRVLTVEKKEEGESKEDLTRLSLKERLAMAKKPLAKMILETMIK